MEEQIRMEELKDRPVTMSDLAAFRINLIFEISSLLDKKFEARSGPEIGKTLRSREVRRLLNISASTLQSYRLSGLLRAKKVNGTYFYDKNDIKKFEPK